MTLAYGKFPITADTVPSESSNPFSLTSKMLPRGRLCVPRGLNFMRLQYVLAVLLLATAAQAKEPKHYQSGKLVKMESVKCGTDQKDGKSLASEMIGTDSSHMKTQELLCQEYVLQTDSVIYRIRPRDQKHPELLPIGEMAQFRLDKDRIVLRVEDLDDKDRNYTVISMTPNDSSAQSAATARAATR